VSNSSNEEIALFLCAASASFVYFRTSGPFPATPNMAVFEKHDSSG
jgi:hypothetical protein